MLHVHVKGFVLRKRNEKKIIILMCLHYYQLIMKRTINKYKKWNKNVIMHMESQISAVFKIFLDEYIAAV